MNENSGLGEVELEARPFNSIVFFTDQMSYALVYSLIALLVAFELGYATVTSRAPERISSVSKYYSYEDEDVELGLNFGFAVKGLDRIAPHLLMRGQIMRKGSNSGFDRISFNRTMCFFKNSSVVSEEREEFTNVRVHFDGDEGMSSSINFIDEEITHSYDSVSFLFMFPRSLDRIEGFNFVWLYTNDDAFRFLSQLNGIFAAVTVYCFICFLIVVWNDFRFNTYLFPLASFVLLFFGFGESTLCSISFDFFVFLLKMKLWSALKHFDSFLWLGILLFVHEFLDHFDVVLGYVNHLIYCTAFSCIALGICEPKTYHPRDLLYGLVGAVSAITGLIVGSFFPMLHLLENSFVPLMTYRTTHWMIGLLVIFSEVPLKLNGHMRNDHFQVLGEE
jgi:hypothetical protein